VVVTENCLGVEGLIILASERPRKTKNRSGIVNKTNIPFRASSSNPFPTYKHILIYQA